MKASSLTEIVSKLEIRAANCKQPTPKRRTRSGRVCFYHKVSVNMSEKIRKADE